MKLHSFTFRKENYNPKYNTITLKMTAELFKDQIRYGEVNEVEIVSPSGKKLIFNNHKNIMGGSRYYCGDINLKLMYEL